MEFNREALRNNIIKYRKSANLTQKSLSELTGLHKKYISDLESNPKRLPSMEALAKIATALNVTVDLLLYENISSNYENIPDDELLNGIHKSLKNMDIKNLQKINQIANCFK